MRKDDFKAGEEWAHRASQSLGAPAARVELLALPNRKGHTKVKVRHVEGELAGLEEFVHITHLRCRWKDWKKVERDEAKESAFLNYMSAQPDMDKTVSQAATAVLTSSGEDLYVDEYRNYTRFFQGGAAALERVAARAGVTDKPWDGPHSFRNRDGDLYLPSSALLDLALAFARSEPETVNLYLDTEEQELLQEGYAFGERYKHKWVIEQKPAWALARAWAAKHGARDHLKDELKRLQRLVREAVAALRDAGNDRMANRLERGLQGK